MNWAKNVYWMYGVVVTDEFGISRDDLTARLAEAGIETRTFFCPMNQQPCLQRRPDYRHVPSPVADDLWTRGLYLPSAHTLSDESLGRVCDAIAAARG